MKKLHLCLTVLSGIFLLVACSKKDNTPVTPPSNQSDTINVRGTISSSTTWKSNKVYRLRGYVYVDSPAVLTIEAGTKIISNRDSAGVLVIYKGAKIIAEGTKDKPIVFTSGETNPKPGDVGGLVLVGKATGNGNHAVLEGGVDASHKSFGGNDDHDNSGIIKYVRIEYAGKAVNPNDEINGLSLYAVGDGTTIDYVQVIRGLDDAFEFFGGSVNCKHLIAYNCFDDDFDMDDGYHGKIQFAISIKDPLVTDKTAPGDYSNNFEVDNTDGKSKPYTATPITHPLLSNFTAIGPNNAPNTNPYHGYGMRWRRGAQFELVNSIVIGGQKAGIDLDDDPTAIYYRDGISGFKNSLLHAVTNVCQVDKLNDTTILTSNQLKQLVIGRDSSVIFTNPADVMLTDPFNNQQPNLMPKQNSPALTKGAKFEGNFNNSFFERVNFIGAIGTDDWTSGWTVWNK
ncbi:MAG: hypothetical protein K6T34_01835 [Thermoflavifilum sp.]|nr:hypothetical protein [Thermoflavifilum sp.]